MVRVTARDRLADFLHEKTVRRFIALATFITLAIVFRRLLLLMVFFVVFERGLALVAGPLTSRLKLGRTLAATLVYLATAGLVGLAAWLSSGRLGALLRDTRQNLPSRIAELRTHPWMQQLEDTFISGEGLVDGAQHYAADVMKSANDLGHVVAWFVVALVMAFVYFVEEDALRAFKARLDATSLLGTLVRWVDHAGEAVALTVQLQLIVAAVNSVLTLPILLLLGLKSAHMLMLLIFAFGLIPIVGNLMSGAILSVLAYQASGWLGVALFFGLTFVLHKVEAYYLNPRLTSRHVELPAFLLIVSLVSWEHLLGFSGLFLSFPILFVAGRIRAEFHEEDQPRPAAAPPPVQGLAA